MRVRIIFLCCFSISVCSAQEGSVMALPVIIPPSPEVAQLGKVGSLSAGLHTGAANVSIPLYSLGVDKAKVDIMLSYSSNGVKVDEIPGVVGMGWNLIAGGVVSRTIHDEPDGNWPYSAPPSNPYAENQAMLTYLLDATKRGDAFDTEYDEFNYSFNGMSGKFFLNPANGEGYCIPHNTFQVKVHNYNGAGSKKVDIKTPDGVLYKFGYLNKEETRSISISGGGSGSVIKGDKIETAWFLETIITPEGSSITFNYTPVTVETNQGPYQTLIKPTVAGDAGCNFSCTSTYAEQTGVNLIKYRTYRLSSIATDNGVLVNFGYEARPDASGDVRLKILSVSANVGGVTNMTKRYKFEYYDPTDFNNSTNHRFFLSKLRTIDLLTGVDGIPESSLEHSFDYYEPNNMTPRLSYGQDYFGYDNGASNTYFAPFIPGLTGNVVNASNGGNRAPSNDNKRKKGILTRVTYPTGGYEEFTYEPHTILQYFSNSVYSGNASIGGSGLGTFDTQTFISNSFTSTSDQSVLFALKVSQSPAFPDAPSIEGDIIYDFKLINELTGQIVLRKKYLYYKKYI